MSPAARWRQLRAARRRVVQRPVRAAILRVLNRHDQARTVEGLASECGMRGGRVRAAVLSLVADGYLVWVHDGAAVRLTPDARGLES